MHVHKGVFVLLDHSAQRFSPLDHSLDPHNCPIPLQCPGAPSGIFLLPTYMRQEPIQEYLALHTLRIILGILLHYLYYKNSNPCDTNLSDYDLLLQRLVLKKIGCKPPYWNSSSQLPLCSNNEKIIEARRLQGEIAYGDAKSIAFSSLVPCRGLERIQYDLVDEAFDDDLLSANPFFNRSLGILFDFKESTYKELKHVKSMDYQDLIGK